MNLKDDGRCDVLFLIRSMGRGGAERQLSLLARALQARGLRVAVAVFYVGGALERELHDAGVAVVDLQKCGRWSNLGMLRRLMAAARQRRPRVLHAYMPTQNIIALLLRPWLRRQGCAVVCGIRIANLDTSAYGFVAFAVDWAHKLFLDRADCVISNSHAALAQLLDDLPVSCGHAIPNGVEAQRFEFSESKRRQLRTDWGVGHGTIVLGLVGRLDPQKSHLQLLNALALADGALDKVTMVFVGDGPASYRAKVAARASKLGLESRLIWAGAVDDMAAVYAALDVLCLCSVSEGFPNVLGEGMSAGLPCVTTDVGDAAFLVGDCGWVVPPDDTPALATALVAACEALPTWDRTRPLRRIEAEFSVDALADRTLAVLAPFLQDAAQ